MFGVGLLIAFGPISAFTTLSVIVGMALRRAQRR
jgi:hypothetical protein